MEWIEKNVAENADLEEAKKLYQEENPLQGVDNADKALEVIKGNEVLKSALDKETQQRAENALERYKNEKLPEKEKELRAQLEKELNPDETPEQQRLKKLEKELEERDRREQKRQLEDKLAAKASELGFDPQKARRYSAFGEEAEKYLEQDAQDFKSQIEERYKEEIKKRYGNKAPEAPEEHEENSISRAEYDKMDPAQRSKHLKEGGKVHDE